MRRSMAEGRVDRLFVFVAPETRNAGRLAQLLVYTN